MSMKRLLLLSLFALLAVHFFSSTAFIETTAAAEDHGGDIVYTKPVKAVIFSHKAHAEDIGLQCEWCHDKTFEMEALAIQGDKNFNMDSLCNENYCGTCHNGDVSFSTTVQCARCHIGEKGYDRMVKEGKIKPEQEKEKIDVSSYTYIKNALLIKKYQEKLKNNTKNIFLNIFKVIFNSNYKEDIFLKRNVIKQNILLLKAKNS